MKYPNVNVIIILSVDIVVKDKLPSAFFISSGYSPYKIYWTVPGPNSKKTKKMPDPAIINHYFKFSATKYANIISKFPTMVPKLPII